MSHNKERARKRIRLREGALSDLFHGHGHALAGEQAGVDAGEEHVLKAAHVADAKKRKGGDALHVELGVGLRPLLR